MYETLLRPIEVFQIPPLPNIAVVSEKIKISEQKREEKRLRQIAANRAASGAGSSTSSSVNAKRKREDAAEDLDDDEDDDNEMSAVEGLITSKKKMRTDIDEEEEGVSPLPEEPSQADADILKTDGSDPSPQPATTTSHRAPKNPSSLTHPSTKINVSKALPEVRGHTSYLTFACLIPIPASGASGSQEDTTTKAVVNS